MKSKNLLFAVLLFFAVNSFSQTKIEAKDGIHYLTTNIDYPITGTYFFKGAEPTVELNGNGAGFYQLHEQPKKAVTWGIECDEAGVPIFSKGFDNVAYTLWYQYTNPETEEEQHWKTVPFTIHFNSLKMYIQGERSKDYTE
ncbi:MULTISPECIES: hypothetical protein [unclassified Flavobacterium]|uniref:hypothetical protein n=1 Tax=unclassified Flavobacterium TaxID=196869 RepID=UPI000EABEA32|nr:MULTISPECIES: hypothetical protein [unclassified Flavobacterium]MBA4155776.1 hypothetical protein [Flavobacterium sp.]RKS02803.1 hypothetical protein C8C84_2532 [Flavobacterium sp. 102]